LDGQERISQERIRPAWLAGKLMPFDQASSDAANILAETKRPTFHKKSPILKVITSGHTPSLLPNLFVAYGLLPVLI
jgi:hypothetical protein